MFHWRLNSGPWACIASPLLSYPTCPKTWCVEGQATKKFKLNLEKKNKNSSQNSFINWASVSSSLKWREGWLSAIEILLIKRKKKNLCESLSPSLQSRLKGPEDKPNSPQPTIWSWLASSPAVTRIIFRVENLRAFESQQLCDGLESTIKKKKRLHF